MIRDISRHVLSVRGEPLAPGSPDAQWQRLKDLIRNGCDVSVDTIRAQYSGDRTLLGITVPVTGRASAQSVYVFLVARRGRSVHWWDGTSGVNDAVTCNCRSLRHPRCEFARRAVVPSSTSSAATSPSITFIPQYASQPTTSSTSTSPAAAQHSPSSSGSVPLSPSLVSAQQHVPWSARLEIAFSRQVTYSSAGLRSESTMSYHSNASSTVSYDSDRSSTIGPASAMNYNAFFESSPACLTTPDLAASFEAHPPLQEHRIYVKNLHPSTTEEHLIRYFSQAGQVVDADIHYRRGSRVTSAVVSATIAFNSPEEAFTAVSTLHESIWRGRVLVVELYRRRETTRHRRSGQGVAVDNTPRHVPTGSWSDHIQPDASVQETSSPGSMPEGGSRETAEDETSSGPVIVDGSFRRQR